MDLLTKLSDQGLLGLLLAISLLANFQLGRMLLAEKDKRIVASEKVRDDVIAPIGYIRESLAIIQEKIKVSKDAQ